MDSANIVIELHSSVKTINYLIPCYNEYFVLKVQLIR